MRKAAQIGGVELALGPVGEQVELLRVARRDDAALAGQVADVERAHMVRHEAEGVVGEQHLRGAVGAAVMPNSSGRMVRSTRCSGAA